MAVGITRTVKGGLVHLANRFGLEVVRLDKTPKRSLLGLRHLPIRTVIDCGANEGQFAAQMSSEFPEARFLCFEPLVEPYRRLSAWAGTQGGRVVCAHTALGETEGEITMLHSVDHSASSSILRATDSLRETMPAVERTSEVKVTLSTLDAAVAQYLPGAAPEILLKLDVQGYEDRVLRGAPETLSRARACIIEVCTDLLYEGQAGFAELVRILHTHGLEYAGNLKQFYGEDGRVKWLDALFLRPAGAGAGVTGATSRPE